MPANCYLPFQNFRPSDQGSAGWSHIPGPRDGVGGGFLQCDNKKGFVINQETVAIQHFIKFWAINKTEDRAQSLRLA